MSASPTPSGLVLHKQSKVLEVQYEDGRAYRLPFELLRVMSPSAEVKGHGPGQETLQTGKRDVAIVGLAPVGHYAVQIMYSDGHDSGIYTWDYLYTLSTRQDEIWADYLSRLAAAGLDRDAPMPSGGGHAHGHGHAH
ncbi:gamma-butyrobetaine hydroxylase-like domain-containing protein [Pararobbsia silviterrae]|uniref:DUF971 domain-containing protein n=1 Tax=Pararobbsia silviterrae TaxID=1792498 RepID=A0A494Y891_9BURK|nr:DUF971 domain-containing protein [Pararobbsia silviterrae]RKP58902.1 DUF971 domain-containing protein [Pararobbsia silviterrae]